MKVLFYAALFGLFISSSSAQELVFENTNTLGVASNPAFSALNDYSRVGAAVKKISTLSVNSYAFGNINTKHVTINASFLDNASINRGLVQNAFLLGASKQLDLNKFKVALGADFAFRRRVLNLDDGGYPPDKIHPRLGFVYEPQDFEAVHKSYSLNFGGVVSYKSFRLLASHWVIQDVTNFTQLGIMSVQKGDKIELQYGANFMKQGGSQSIDASVGIGYKFLKLGVGTRLAGEALLPRAMVGAALNRFDLNFGYIPGRFYGDTQIQWVEWETVLTYSFFKKGSEKQRLLF